MSTAACIVAFCELYCFYTVGAHGRRVHSYLQALCVESKGVSKWKNSQLLLRRISFQWSTRYPKHLKQQMGNIRSHTDKTQ